METVFYRLPDFKFFKYLYLRMKHLILFAGFLVLFVITGVASPWEQGSIELKSGILLEGELKFREGVYVSEIRFRNSEIRRVVPIDSVSGVVKSGIVYRAIRLKEIIGEPILLGRDLGNSLYRGVFRERECLCNNSFRMVEAYVVREEMSKPVILRKVAFRDRFKEPSVLRRFFAEPSADWSFEGFEARWKARETASQNEQEDH